MVARLRSPNDEPHYFGVQGIQGWEDPPILDNPTETEDDRRSRILDIYTDGGKIKLVAWHRGENTYWISNSLLQSLTNEQMIGIAESCQRDHAEEEAPRRRGAGANERSAKPSE